MICKKCGAEIEDGCLFCTSCGTPINSAQPQQVVYQQPPQVVYQQPQQAIYQQPPQAMYQQQMMQQQPQQKKKKTGKKVAIILGSLAAIAIIAIVAVVILKKDKKTVGQGKLVVNGKEFDISSDDFISSLKDMPLAIQNNNIDGSGQNITVLGEPNYLRVDGFRVTDEVVPESEVGAILGSVANSDKDWARVGRIQGTACLFKDHSVIGISDELTAGGLVYDDRYQGYNEQYVYGVIKLSFIDNYSLDGLDKNSSKKEVIDAGYKPTQFQNVYIDIYSPAGADWDKAEDDFKRLYQKDISNAEVVSTGYKYDIEYGPEYLGAFENTTSILSMNDRERDLGMHHQKEMYESDDEISASVINRRRNENMYLYNESYDDIAIMDMAIGYQLHLLNSGKIDYFVIKQFDVAPGTRGHNSYQGLQYGGPYYQYDDNVVTLYIITSRDDYLEYVEQLGWIK